ncbi:Rab family GTPase [Thermoflexus sp.]|uniref:Rab family GTPase n=1 Tax=Thermoflexus sp. TaxID=1969742 RepID=UPI001771238B|nr:Rab family GTPase [Thermoflexus sp.]
MAPRRRILLVIETADLARYAGFLESAASRWEILALSPSEALAQPIQEEPPDAVLVAVEGVPEGWLESWKRTEPRPLLIQLSAQVSAPRRAPAGPWDWILPAVSPASDLEAMLPFPSGEQRPTIAVRKVLLVGEATVGKTSLAAFYLQRAFDPRRHMTIGVDIHICPVEVEGMAVRLVVWDVGGQRRFAALRDLFYRGAAAGALVFDLSNRLSFYQLLRWWQELRSHLGSIPVLLVGNKADLPREISRWEAESLARAWGTPYFETSCVTGVGVLEFFQALAAAALKGASPAEPG